MFSRIADNYSPVYTVNYGNKQLQPMSFRGEIGLSQNVQKEFSIGNNVAIGTGIAILLAVGADLIFCKGKHIKSLSNS